MKTLNKKIFCFVFLLSFASAVFLGAFLTVFPKHANADTQISSTSIDDLTDSNNYFTVRPTAVARNGGTLQNTTQTVTTDDGERTFYCFKWREISSINFRFLTSLADSKSVFTNYEFWVTAIRTENLQTSFGQATETNPETKIQQLLDGTIIGNNPSIPDVYYYIDENSDTSDSEVKFSGNDFGIYKFDFNYTFIEDPSLDTQAHKKSIGEIYVAILPDDINTIPVSGLGLSDSVSSSKELMNIYQITFSDSELFKYVNPKYIKWSVTGKDKKGIEYDYVQTKGSGNGYYIWQTWEMEGPTFVLDTKNIEGTWTVNCKIFNSDWTEKTTLSTRKLSTIKHKTKSYLWLILGLVFAVIIIATGIGLLIYKLKNRKKD